MLKFLSIPVILAVLVFGYFLSKNSWDVTLTTSVIKYEISQLLGDDKKPTATPVETPEPAAESEAAPATSSHTKDSIYTGSGKSGEASFSDVKREGVHENYEQK